MVAEYRRELTHRLALVSFLALGIGLSTGYVPWHALTLGVLIAFVSSKRARVCALAFGALGLAFRLVPPTLNFESKDFHGTAVVKSMPYNDDQETWVTAEMNGQRYGLKLNHPEIIVPGDRIEAAGQLLPLNESKGTPRGLVGELRPIGRVAVSQTGVAPLRLAVAARMSFVAFVKQSLDSKQAAALDAMCMGVGTGMDDEQWEVFKRTGTVHVVVASGLHAAIAATLIFVALKWIPVSRVVKLSFVGVLVMLYAAAAGFRPAVVRGAMMVCIGGAHYLFSREDDPINSLGLAGLASLAFDPWSLFDVGLWLSFTAVAGLQLFGDRSTLEIRWREGKRLWVLFKASVVATIATAPLLAYAFGQVSLVGLVANLVPLPILESALALSFVSWIVSWISPGLGGFILQLLVSPMIGTMLGVLGWMSRLPFSVAYVGSFSVYWLVPIYGGMIVFWRPKFVQP